LVIVLKNQLFLAIKFVCCLPTNATISKVGATYWCHTGIIYMPRTCAYGWQSKLRSRICSATLQIHRWTAELCRWKIADIYTNPWWL